MDIYLSEEQKRLKVLESYNILDTLPEKELDALVKLAAEVCKTPIALISLIDDKRQWFKANLGLNASETPRNISFCQHAIAQNDDVYEVPNALENEVFVKNPLVTGDPNIRFYAGAPLVNQDGYKLGTLCVIDTSPKKLTDDQKQTLKILSNFVITQFELRKTKMDLESSRNRYLRLVEEAGDIIYTCDMEGRFNFISSAITKFSGYSSEELIGRHFSEIVAPESKKQTNIFYLRQLRNKTPKTNMEFPMIMKNGSLHWIEQTVVLSYHEGEISGFQGIVRDIADRKTAEEKADRAMEIFSKIFKSSPVAMSLASFNPNQFSEVNESFVKLSGYSNEDVIGKNSGEIGLLPEKERVIVSKIFSEKGYLKNYETKIITKTGEDKHILFSTEVLNIGGTKLGLSTYFDITKRKNYEIELFNARALLSEAMQIGKLGSFENNVLTQTITWSEEIYRMMEMPINTRPLTYEEYMSAIHPDDLVMVLDRIKKTIESKEPDENVNRFITGKGNVKWIQTRVIPFYDNKGNITAFRGTMQDITISKELEKELIKAKELAEQSSVAKEQFLANMSHEIRTPINGVIGFTELLTKTKLNKEQKEFVAAIDTSGKNLLSVVNNILDYSKIDAGMMTIEEIPLSIRSTFSSLSVLFSQRAREKKIKISFTADKNIPEVVIGDSARLTQIITNLVGNAIKFTDKGRIQITATLDKKTKEKTRVKFSVLDTGIGIPKDKITSVFERFTQGSNDTNRKYGGTGLGLSIVKKLVELQEGSINVKSILGKGSSFNFTIVYKTAPEGSHVSKKKNSSVLQTEAGNKKLNILLVEDNKINQKLTVRVLNDFGFKNDVAENGKIAVDKLKSKRFDLVIMDMQMPVMDGYEATGIIRNKLKSEVPILAMTAHAMSSEKEKCLRLGMNDYISKPFKAQELYSIIHKLTNGPKISTQKKAEIKKEVVKTKTVKASTLVNLDRLKKLSNNDASFICEILEIFTTEAPIDVKAIDTGIKKKDLVLVKNMAHKLKSSTALIGLDKISEGLASIEKLAEEGKPDKVKIIFAEISKNMTLAFKETKQEIKNFKS